MKDIYGNNRVYVVSVWTSDRGTGRMYKQLAGVASTMKSVEMLARKTLRKAYGEHSIYTFSGDTCAVDYWPPSFKATEEIEIDSCLARPEDDPFDDPHSFKFDYDKFPDKERGQIEGIMRRLQCEMDSHKLKEENAK